VRPDILVSAVNHSDVSGDGSESVHEPSSLGVEAAAKAWRADLPKESHYRTNQRGGMLFGLSGGAYLCLFVGACLPLNPWLRVICVMFTPVVIGALFVIGHDAAHHSLTPTAWVNALIGRLAMLPAWHPYTSWCHAHNTLHHGGTCLRGKHPDFTPFDKQEFDQLPRWRRLLERIYRTPLGIGLYYAIDFYGRYLLFPRDEFRLPRQLLFQLDRLLVLSFLILQVVVAQGLIAQSSDPVLPRWLLTLVVVLLPWSIWIWFMGFVSFVQHTHPSTVWYDDEDEWSFYRAQLGSSTHVTFPWPIERVLHNIMDHPAHHIDPTIPLYRLPASQRLLEQSAPHHSLVVPFTLTEYLRICRTCKLYDYQRKCWLDFDGNWTTDPRA
jgi:omega-6 fatty acid desaturase (delta-12 desaturase)